VCNTWPHDIEAIMTKPSKRLVAVLAVTIALTVTGVGLLAAWGIYPALFPRDRVLVTIHNVPADTDYVSLAVQRGTAVNHLELYHRDEIGVPFATSSSWSLYGVSGTVSKHVQWAQGDRYGVVIHRRTSGWSLVWYDPTEMQIMRWAWGWDGGNADITYRDDKTTSISEILFLGLGLDEPNRELEEKERRARRDKLEDEIRERETRRANAPR
jgi:hypothetical protein